MWALFEHIWSNSKKFLIIYAAIYSKYAIHDNLDIYLGFTFINTIYHKIKGSANFDRKIKIIDIWTTVTWWKKVVQ